nr:MAG TPA: hypothetical protein [Caudoviricetes sp.]
MTTFLFKTQASRRLRDGCCCASAGNDHYVKSGRF